MVTSAVRHGFTDIDGGQPTTHPIGRCHRGDDHRAAAELIEQATPDGKQLAAVLRRLLDVKGRAHYGVTVVPTRSARDAAKWAGRLVERAAEELAR